MGYGLKIRLLTSRTESRNKEIDHGGLLDQILSQIGLGVGDSRKIL